jgi:hypothetical protein
LADVSKEQEELLSYRDEVLRELERRSLRVKELELAVAEAEYALDSTVGTLGVLTGETFKAMTKVAYRARLKRELAARLKDRDEALVDLKRAQDRLSQVDGDLAQLELQEDV